MNRMCLMAGVAAVAFAPLAAQAEIIGAKELKPAMVRAAGGTFDPKLPGMKVMDVTAYVIKSLKLDKAPIYEIIRTSDAPVDYPNCRDTTVPSSSYSFGVTLSNETSVSVTETTTSSMTAQVGVEVDGIGASVASTYETSVEHGTTNSKGKSVETNVTIQLGDLAPKSGARIVPLEKRAVWTSSPYTMVASPIQGKVGIVNPLISHSITQTVDFVKLAAYDGVDLPVVTVKGIMSVTTSAQAAYVVEDMLPAEVQAACEAAHAPQAAAAHQKLQAAAGRSNKVASGVMPMVSPMVPRLAPGAVYPDNGKVKVVGK